MLLLHRLTLRHHHNARLGTIRLNRLQRHHGLTRLLHHHGLLLLLHHGLLLVLRLLRSILLLLLHGLRAVRLLLLHGLRSICRLLLHGLLLIHWLLLLLLLRRLLLIGRLLLLLIVRQLRRVGGSVHRDGERAQRRVTGGWSDGRLPSVRRAEQRCEQMRMHESTDECTSLIHDGACVCVCVAVDRLDDEWAELWLRTPSAARQSNVRSGWLSVCQTAAAVHAPHTIRGCPSGSATPLCLSL